MPSRISEVRVTPIFPNGTLVAFASILFEGQLRLSDLAVHSLNQGKEFSISYPKKRLFNGAEVNIIYPISRDVDDAVKSAIVSKYLDMTK